MKRGVWRNQGYCLADGIYPHWETFVQTFSQPDTLKKKLFAKQQESARKDVERAFGVLQARWHILTAPCRLWFQEDMALFVKACVILHNMIVDDQRSNHENDPVLENPDQEQMGYLAHSQRASRPPSVDLSTLTTNMFSIRDEQEWAQLRQDLIDHLWDRHGS